MDVPGRNLKIPYQNWGGHGHPTPPIKYAPGPGAIIIYVNFLKTMSAKFEVAPSSRINLWSSPKKLQENVSWFFSTLFGSKNNISKVGQNWIMARGLNLLLNQ
jgi:hypothetical protein